jgi:hypothetical protein
LIQLFYEAETFRTCKDFGKISAQHIAEMVVLDHAAGIHVPFGADAQRTPGHVTFFQRKVALCQFVWFQGDKHLNRAILAPISVNISLEPIYL